MRKFLIALAALSAMFFFVACGGSDSKTEDTQDSDAVDKPDTEEVPGEQTELVYPEVGEKCNKVGDIAHNLIIYDDVDAKHQLAEWYQPNNPSSKLIWLIFTTYDCPPCLVLKEDLLVINKAEYRERGLKILLIFNGSYVDGPQVDREPKRLADVKDAYLAEYPDTAQFELYGYLKDQKIFNKFKTGISVGYPTWLFIDASTMEIVDYGEGWGENMVGPAETEIEELLDTL